MIASNTTRTPGTTTRGHRPAAQKGVVLVFALIALVAMTLAALAMMRSTETSNLVAGNIGLKQGAAQEADRIMNVAFACLDSSGALLSASLENNRTTCNYYASVQPDTQRPFGIPDVLETVSGTTDPATGNTSAFVIERLCSATGAFSDQNCLESPFGKKMEFEDHNWRILATPPQALYRISIKVSGPRNVAAYSQMILNAAR